jgi:hypothetical protein
LRLDRSRHFVRFAARLPHPGLGPRSLVPTVFIDPYATDQSYWRSSRGK